MKISKLSSMKHGWFIGNFKPAAFKTKGFEVAYKVHKKGEFWPMHYQKKATEINLLVKGRMALWIPGKTTPGLGELKFVKSGDIFIFKPGVKAHPDFLTDCEIVCVKVPSLPGDKVVCE